MLSLNGNGIESPLEANQKTNSLVDSLGTTAKENEDSGCEGICCQGYRKFRRRRVTQRLLRRNER